MADRHRLNDFTDGSDEQKIATIIEWGYLNLMIDLKGGTDD